MSIGSKFESGGINEAINKIEELEKKNEKAITTFRNMGLALVGAATVGVVAMRSLVNSFAESEKAENLLSNALRTTGNYSETTKSKLISLSSEIQKYSKYTDEAVLAAETLMLQLGVMPDEMDKATKTAANLASALGIDLHSAAMLVGKAVEGNVTMLGRYGIKLDEASVSAGGASYVLQELNKRFGGAAQAEAETYIGKIEKLKNQWDDFAEKLGSVLLPLFSKFADALGSIVGWLNSLSPETVKAIANFILWGTAITGLLGGLALLIAYFPKLVAGFISVSGAAHTTAGAFIGITGAMGAAYTAATMLVNLYDEWLDRTNKVNGEEAKLLKTLEGKIEWHKNEKARLVELHKANIDYMNDGGEIARKIKLEQEAIDKLTKQLKIHTESVVKDGKIKRDLTDEEIKDQISIYKNRVSIYEDDRTLQAKELKNLEKFLKDRLKLVKKNTKEESDLEKELSDTKKELRQIELDNTQNVLGTLSTFQNAWYALESLNIQNSLKINLDSLNQRYTNEKGLNDTKIENIQKEIDALLLQKEQGVAINDDYVAQLELNKKQLVDSNSQLDSKYKDDTKKLQDKADEEERERRSKLKPVMIAQALANTAEGATKALAQGGIFGIITAAIVMAAGMLQVATIEAQKFAQGGLVMGATLGVIGEAGPELALPLENPKTVALLSRAMSQAGTQNNYSNGTNITVNVPIDKISDKRKARELGQIVGDELFRRISKSRKV